MKPGSVLPEIRQLRRYARLLTSDQTTADNLVAAVLEYLMKTNTPDAHQLPLRAKLFKVFHEMLAEQERHLTPTGVGFIDMRLSALAPMPRTVFLLVAVEQLSLHEAAIVLNLTPRRIAGYLDEAGHAIASQVATSVLIIEDEPMIALAIESLAIELGHTIDGIAATKKEARTRLEEKRPGLILADVQLADGTSSIETLREVLPREVPPAIFITAFPELVAASTLNRVIIPKPFDPSHVKAVISQTLFFLPPGVNRVA